MYNSGTISGVLYGVIGGDGSDIVVNSGEIDGGTVAIYLGAGDDQLTLLPGSVINGGVYGGDGYNQVTLSGTGTGSFAGAIDFQHLNVASGNWTLTAASVFSDGIDVEKGATLTGGASVLIGSIEDNGALIVDQAFDASLSASLGGAGLFEKTGAGVLTVGSERFTGQTDVIGGTLLLNGTLPSAVTVEQSAKLAGSGEVASATIAAGGTVAPSIGTLAIAGNLNQQAGSTYAATIMPGSISSLIAVGGTATIGDGAKITVSRGAGDYVIGTRYLLLTAAGGVTGAYTLAQSAVDGTELRLASDGSDVYADLVRAGASLRTVAVNGNQANVAAAFGTLGAGNAAYAALTLDPSDTGVRDALSQLSAEVHASVHTAMVHDAMLVEGAALGRIEAGAAQSSGLWAQILGNHGEDDGTGGAADTTRNTYGGIAGYDMPIVGGLRAGIVGGYTRTKLSIDDRSSSARLHTGHFLAYAGGDLGAFQVRFGLGDDWGRISTARAISFAGFSDHDEADYRGNTLHGFGEIGYALPLGSGMVQPFVGGSAYRTHTDGFEENGGSSALDGDHRTDTTKFSDAGLKVETPIIEAVSVHASLAWQHAFGDVRPDSVLSFGGNAASFVVAGASLSRDAASSTAEVAWQPTSHLRVSVGYSGLIGRAGADNAGRFTIGMMF